MITRTITFADENGRPNRHVVVVGATQRGIVAQTARALQSRHSLDKYVFTSTVDTNHAAPAVLGEDETIARVADSPATKERKERAAAARWGMSGKQVATVAEYFGGAPLNSVQARLQRDAK